MCKIAINLPFLFAVLLLCSCSAKQSNVDTNNIDLVGGARIELINKEDEGTIAVARLEEIIQAINSKDKNSIKNMFSEQAQSEIDDFDGEIEYLFQLIDGNIESWEKIGGSVDESDNDGKTTTKSRYRFNVYTSKEQYLCSILEYIKDGNNPKNIGVYCIKVINVKDEEPLFSNAGIYRPQKDDEGTFSTPPTDEEEIIP